MDRKRQGLELSAFFVGILYFIVQWIWQMQNAKNGLGLPYAYSLMIGVSVTGMFSLHSLLVDGQYPAPGLRAANAVLFGIFAGVGAVSFASARASSLAVDQSLAAKWLYAETWAVITIGLAIGLFSYGLARLAQKLSGSSFYTESPDSPRSEA